MSLTNKSPILSGLIGLCVGDALGVPVEFSSRKSRQLSPVTDMQGYGTYNQPPGTWSDDSSLTFCLAQALSEDLLTDQLYDTLGNYFCRWYQEAFWTAYNEVFDIGNATARAINKLIAKVPPLEAGGITERDNGNGSLMRILPLAFCYKLTDFPQLIDHGHKISRVTHGHPISQIGCGIYLSIAVGLLEGKSPMEAYHEGIKRVENIYQQGYFFEHINHFSRIMSGEIHNLAEDLISSSGYVIHTLEASIWCLLNYDNYEQTVLKAVNLGEDTDTTGAVTGGLAGIYYGIEEIPSLWVEKIAKLKDIIALAEGLEKAIKR
jgi:ADP-ribosyl-[dinitrogen reductase] hydrolase